MRVSAHASLAFRRQRRELGFESPALIEKLLRAVALHPFFKDLHVLGIFMHLTHRHLVAPPIALGALAVDFLGTSPTLGRPQYNHRPPWPFYFSPPAFSTGSCTGLNPFDLSNDLIESGGHQLVHLRRFIPFHEMRCVTVAAQKLLQLFVTDARQHRGIGDLVAIEV